MQLAEGLAAHACSHVGMGTIPDIDVFLLDKKELFYALKLFQSVNGAIRAD